MVSAYRALVDTGAETFIIHRRVFSVIKPRPALGDGKANIQIANGTFLTVDSYAKCSNRSKSDQSRILHHE